MTVNEKLAELLDWLGISQTQLADAIGVSKATVNSYVTERNNISVDMAEKIAAALGVTPWTLLNGAPLPATSLDLTPVEVERITDMRGLSLDQLELLDQCIQTMKRQNERKRLCPP